MDFWSRVLSHTPLSAGPSRKDIAKDPVRRRHRFEKEYGQLLQTWRNSSNLVHDAGAVDAIEPRIQELTEILVDESRRPLPHTCLNFAAEKQVYVPIGKIAATCYNLKIIREAVYFFGTLIESEDDAFVESDTFAANITNLFVRITGANSIHLDQETETKVVELAFNITTKIRLRPDILPAWFKVRRKQTLPDDGPGESDEKEPEMQMQGRVKGKTQRKDFPLFYILMDYIHSEGKAGDFARTGLLYIIESASAASSDALEQWIVESDLSTLMATGLCALYSQLSRKLVIDYQPNDLPPILALSDYEHPRPAFEVVSSCSSDFQVQLDTFLSHLLFWQDVLNHCRSVEVKTTLLEHFQVIFLQQLLYPSLLESSDIDGGSSVAVLTYLRRIIESLDHPDMIQLILHYLLALPDSPSLTGPLAAKSAVSAARKRKSMDLATLMAQKADTAATPILFSLVDLILACLKSHSQQTIHVTLQLVSTILRRHHRYAVSTLVRTGPVSGISSHRTVGAHQQDIEFFMSIAGAIGGQDDFDHVYNSILRDAIVRLEGHPCNLKLIAPKVSTNNHELPVVPSTLPGAPRNVPAHTIRPDDPLLTTILDRLQTFFVNPVSTNLSTTEAILDLGACGNVSLEGWVLRHPSSYSFDDDICTSPFDAEIASLSDGEDTRDATRLASKMQECRRRPKWAGLPRLLTVLQALADQLAVYRHTIPRFDELLQQRREAFQTADIGPLPPPPASRSKSTAGAGPHGGVELANTDGASSARPSVLENFAQRLLSELGTPTRSANSTRSRIDPGRVPFSTPTSGGSRAKGGTGATPSGPGPATPLAKSASAGLAEASLGTDTPRSGRTAAIRSLSPSSERDVAVYGDGRVGLDEQDALAASQKAALQLDASNILARRVGIAVAQPPVAPIPLHFDKPALVTTDNASDNADDEVQQESGNASSDVDDSAAPSESDEPAPSSEENTATVSHVLTNTVLFQSFLLELAALVQTRAGFFDEVRFV
ncbi:hypothetical protein SEPCBS119000_003739 [Sporothrix epigloea]|uniref:Retinoic acid induced 16-like protein-domain-containing protein n=1 Tax=Sporothrix epigloea TaxID=1892477 RepID=A0ABP0DNA8_9PEZI